VALQVQVDDDGAVVGGLVHPVGHLRVGVPVIRAGLAAAPQTLAETWPDSNAGRRLWEIRR
jgi:hypothetical protein